MGKAASVLVLAESLFKVATLNGLEVIANNLGLLGNVLRKRIIDWSNFIVTMCKVTGISQLAISISKMSANACFILAAIWRRGVNYLSARSLAVASGSGTGLILDVSTHFIIARSRLIRLLLRINILLVSHLSVFIICIYKLFYIYYIKRICYYKLIDLIL